MKVSEVIELSALLLDIELTEDIRNNLVRCYNLVEQELATDYFPILEVDKFFHVEDKIYYKDFSRKPYMLKGIQDFHGDSVSFRLASEYINLIKNYNGGTFFVKYYYLPEDKELYSNSTYGAEYISILKYGIAAEYCLMQGNFEQAKIYSDKYKERIKLKGPKKKKCE
jgi:hypothetical protein